MKLHNGHCHKWQLPTRKEMFIYNKDQSVNFPSIRLTSEQKKRFVSYFHTKDVDQQKIYLIYFVQLNWQGFGSINMIPDCMFFLLVFLVLFTSVIYFFSWCLDIIHVTFTIFVSLSFYLFSAYGHFTLKFHVPWDRWS